MKKSTIERIISVLDCLIAIFYQISSVLQKDPAKEKRDHTFSMLFLLFSMIFFRLSLGHKEDSALEG